MKISKEQRQKNIESVFKAVIRLSKTHGFETLTMKAIAKEAGIGEATIYNYFPKKELLLTGYLDWSVAKAITMTAEEPLAKLRFTEALHLLIENHLEVLAPGKDFFAAAVKTLFVNPLALTQTPVADSRERYLTFVRERFQHSLSQGEFPAPPFHDFILALLWDFHIGILYYWLKDEDTNYMKTTELLDLSMQAIEELFKSDLAGRIYGVAHFLFKEHILGKLLNAKGLA